MKWSDVYWSAYVGYQKFVFFVIFLCEYYIFVKIVTEEERILFVCFERLRHVLTPLCCFSWLYISSHFPVVTGHTMKRLMKSVLFVSFQSVGRWVFVSMEFPALELKTTLNKHLLLFTALTSLLVVVCLSMVSSCTKRKLTLSSKAGMGGSFGICDGIFEAFQT